MRETVTFLDMKDQLRAAALRGLPVKILTPWFHYEAKSITEDEAEQIFRDMRRAGSDWFRARGYDQKRKGK